MGARAVGPWVGEQKPHGKTPLRGNPCPESTYLPTLDNRRLATATISLLASTGCASALQHLACCDLLVDGSELLGYKQFVCTCGHQRSGEP